MDEQQQPSHVIRNTAIQIALFLLVRRYAWDYLVRTYGPEAAQDYFRGTARRMKAALLVVVAFFLIACVVSEKSLGAADVIFCAAIAFSGIMAFIDVSKCVILALREAAWRHETRGPLASRMYETGRDYAPRLFQ